MNFGDRITIRNKLIRHTEYQEENINGFFRRQRYKLWAYIPTKSVEVIFLGWRTLKNGATDWDSDCGWQFCHHGFKKVRAALVCADGNTNPFYAIVEESE